MKKNFKHLLSASLFSSLLITTPFISTSLTSCSSSKHLRLTREDWEDHTKQALNDCLDMYGIDSSNYSKNNYAVFDFDNTSAIFDIAHKTTLYQLQHMCFDFSNTSWWDALTIGIDQSKLDQPLSGYGFSYRQIINEISGAFDNLVSTYGMFTYKGITDETKLEQIHNDPNWQDFSAKVRFLYDLLSDFEGGETSYTWSINIFSGMTHEQVYDISKRALESCIDQDSKTATLKAATPVGDTQYLPEVTLVDGVSVTENIKELYKTLQDNGIDVWICSASCIDTVLAGLDVYGLSPYVTGVIGMTNKMDDNGKYLPGYDHEKGYDYIRQDGNWVQTSKPNKYAPFGLGKSNSIEEMICPNYENKGPLMVFGDSTGDFNFTTEFKDTKLGVIFNRADRSVTDGGGLLAAIAMYQQNNNVTLKQANNNADTLYCLQGRDDNGKRSLRNSNKTIKLGQSEEKLFLNSDNYTLLNYMETNKLSIETYLNTLCIKGTKINDSTTVGFLKEYIGYHKR